MASTTSSSSDSSAKNSVFVRWAVSQTKIQDYLTSQNVPATIVRDDYVISSFATPEEAAAAIARVNNSSAFNGLVTFSARQSTTKIFEKTAKLAAATQIICTPDVSATAPDDKSLKTYTAPVSAAGGAVFPFPRVAPTDGKLVQTVSFKSQVGGVLSSDAVIGGEQLKVLRIYSNVRGDSLLVRVNFFHPKTSSSGSLSFRHFINKEGNVEIVSLPFVLVEGTTDTKKDVAYITLSSITADATGVWSELRLSLNRTSVPFNTYIPRAPRRPQGGNRSFNGPRRGGNRGGPRPSGKFEGKPRRGPSNRGPRRNNNTSSSSQ